MGVTAVVPRWCGRSRNDKGGGSPNTEYWKRQAGRLYSTRRQNRQLKISRFISALSSLPVRKGRATAVQPSAMGGLGRLCK